MHEWGIIHSTEFFMQKTLEDGLCTPLYLCFLSEVWWEATT